MRSSIRWAGGDADRIRQYAAELVALAARRYRSPVAPRLCRRCCRRPAPCRSCSRASPTRSGRLRREPGAAGRQRHRFTHVRIQLERQNGWSCSSRSRRASREPRSFGIPPIPSRDRPVRRDPGRGAAARDGGESDQRTRRRRDRARRRCIRALREWRSDRRRRARWRRLIAI